MTHGTTYGYQKGCRCDDCRAAALIARRKARARARALNSPAYQRELARGRALKDRYRGSCEACGAPTSGCYGPGLAPRLCVRCSPVESGRKRRGTGATQERLFALLADEGPTRAIEISRRLGISQAHVSVMLNALLRYGQVARLRRGVYALPGAGGEIDEAKILETLACETCGESFQSYRSTARYCSKACRRRSRSYGRECSECGTVFFIDDGQYKRRRCYECSPVRTRFAA